MRLGAALFASVGVLVWSSSALASPARTSVNFGTAPNGPAAEFSWLKQMPLRPSAPRVVVTGRARRITDLTFNGRDHLYFVAPTLAGGYCTAVSGPYGGSGCADHRPRLDPGLTGDQSGPILFHGSFSNAAAARLVVTYQDGSKNQIPFVWVNTPINAGFFLYQVPTANRRPGDRPRLLSIFNKTGQLLAQQTLRIDAGPVGRSLALVRKQRLSEASSGWAASSGFRRG